MGQTTSSYPPFCPPAVSSIADHALILKPNGNICSFGSNDCCQLGFGDLINRTTVNAVPISTKFKSLSGGQKHTAAVSEDGSLWIWGLGMNRELLKVPTRISNTNSFETVVSGNWFSLALNEKGEVYGLGSICNSFFQIPTRLDPSMPFIRMISAGSDHCLLLDTTGYIWSFGFNEQGQLGLGDTNKRQNPCLIPNIRRVIHISSGNDHNIVVDSNHQIWSFGANFYGQLGTGDKQDRTSAVHIVPGKDVCGVWCFGNSSFLKDSYDFVWAFGCNSHGQLGSKDFTEKSSPTVSPELIGMTPISGCLSSVFFIDMDDQVYACGQVQAAPTDAIKNIERNIVNIKSCFK
jgi:alpha-tubulin suppressor-like RCC1 family protein